MHARSGQKVQIVGWSQGGGPMPRWALRWWPDIRQLVDGVIGIDPPNRGSAVPNLFGCEIVALLCPPAGWQQVPQSNFTAALNSGQMTFPEVEYTVIYNRLSNIVQPNLDGHSSALPPGGNVTNIALQDFCGGMLSILPDHAVAVGSPATLALVLDTLAHPGAPGEPSRVDRATCGQLGTPFVSAATQVQAIGQLYADGFTRTIPRDTVEAEPALRCAATSTPRLRDPPGAPNSLRRKQSARSRDLLLGGVPGELERVVTNRAPPQRDRVGEIVVEHPPRPLGRLSRKSRSGDVVRPEIPARPCFADTRWDRAAFGVAVLIEVVEQPYRVATRQIGLQRPRRVGVAHRVHEVRYPTEHDALVEQRLCGIDRFVVDPHFHTG
jgi:hypothetical protein